MKTNISFQPILFLVLTGAFITACNKSETITINIKEPVALFRIEPSDPFYIYLPTVTTYIDSSINFLNSSDSGANISYRWDFGDGNTSEDKNPKHSYNKRGSYTVTLTVSNDNKAFAIAQDRVEVIRGQQHISVDNRTSVYPVAIEETASNEFLVLASIGDGTYNMFLLDSLMKQKSMKAFPSGYHLVSMKPTADGNYIFTGSSKDIAKSDELLKMKADGTQVWAKVLSPGDQYSYAEQTSDGGYAITGNRPVKVGNETINYTVVIKSDANGNLQWQKVLDQVKMTNTKNALIEPDGMVVSGIKRGSCVECDSIIVVKLDNNGNLTWKNSVQGGLNNFTWWDNSITKIKNGNYAVSNGYTRGIFFYSPSGEFLDRRLVPYPVGSVTGTNDGNMVALQTEYSNGSRINISKMSADGTLHWNVFPDGRDRFPGGFRCCSNSWPVSALVMRNGNILVYGFSYVGDNNHAVVLMIQLNEAGQVK